MVNSAKNINFASMNERINWIDWGKAIAATGIVFIHLPQSQEWFYFRYVQACTITIFFFISGYLKKDRGSGKENWRKYWNSLIIPYLLYNAIVYPYWLIRFYLQNEGFPDFMQAIKPIIGALLLEHESSFAEPLNGPLWYLPAILIMHIIIDLCRKTRYLHHIMIALCIVSFFLYAANIQWQFMHNMTPMGIFRRLPYYYIGYVMGQQRLFRDIRPIHNALTSICLLSASLLFFYWHLHEDRTLPHAILFYPVNICFLFCILYLCKALDHFTPKYITNISLGTLVIIGLHFPIIGGINYIIEHYASLSSAIGYTWYEALPLALFITGILYPIILFSKHHAPILIGKKK